MPQGTTVHFAGTACVGSLKQFKSWKIARYKCECMNVSTLKPSDQRQKWPLILDNRELLGPRRSTSFGHLLQQHILNETKHIYGKLFSLCFLLYYRVVLQFCKKMLISFIVFKMTPLSVFKLL